MVSQLEHERRNLNSLAGADYEDANSAFREILKANMFVTSFVFALIGAFFLKNDSISLCIKVLGVGIIVSLVASLIFGLIQFLVEYRHSREWGNFRQNIANNIANGAYDDYKSYRKAFFREKRPNSESSVWAMYVSWAMVISGLLGSLVFLLTIIF